MFGYLTVKRRLLDGLRTELRATHVAVFEQTGKIWREQRELRAEMRRTNDRLLESQGREEQLARSIEQLARILADALRRPAVPEPAPVPAASAPVKIGGELPVSLRVAAHQYSGGDKADEHASLLFAEQALRAGKKEEEILQLIRLGEGSSFTITPSDTDKEVPDDDKF